jgi:DNA polymerase V
VVDLCDEDVRRHVMSAFPVGDIWGVGGATARKLDDLGITTAGALRDMPMKQARAVGTVVLERLVAELRGVPSAAVEMVQPQRKGMAVGGHPQSPRCVWRSGSHRTDSTVLRLGAAPMLPHQPEPR